ncbi:inhibitor of Bruton tyrosine kinase isoform X4 [Ascaphus truei]|uniref:inhibitor of Bruton tyrosine kinase isoform X4 n=1 Tax=Ascaphus truei TaxID=8439 RepID=UPI003F595C7C
MGSVWPECTLRCRSSQHAMDIISVVTRGSEHQIKAFLSSYCYNAATLKDDFGRNVVHIAASCGKKGVLDWLAEAKGVDLSIKDKESGWTALHRSIFYGHIDCALSLLRHGSSLYIQDKDGFTALDLVMKDRSSHIVFKTSDPTEPYTWGNNINFTLGHGGQQSKHHPELVDMFPRSGVYIKQMVLCKFHAVFLTQKGQVYTCGHGQGGRLGHGDELTCLVPRLVEALSSHPCSLVAAAKDHTVVLTEDGYVYTFGVNTFHQLGITPPPSNCSVPRQIQAKTLKGKTVIGVAAGRFHTVLWTKDAVYTMGLNGGQLGYLLDPNGEKLVSCPRQVSALHHKDIAISLVSASDGATVCVSERGDIYLLTEYQCKKLASKQFNLTKVLVSGGFLEYKADSQHLKENGGQPVCILALDRTGRVFCLKSPSSSMKLCRWIYGRQVFMSDVALNKNEMMFVTQEGEGFTGKWMVEKKRNIEKKENSISDSTCHCDTHSVYERICLQKLCFVHRAVSVTTDPNGCNFAVLQSDPKTRLDGVRYENGRINVVHKKSVNRARFNQKKCSSLCDVTMRSEDGKEFHCHKCVLCARLEYFHSMLSSSWIEASCCTALEMPINSDVLQVILDYIYTDQALGVKESSNVEFICNVLVVADQLLIIRLKEICEVTITERLTLRNAAELLEFASLYNAEQLKLSCFQFIGQNMAALLEARSLDVLSDDVLKDMSNAYRQMITAMDTRMITPYLDCPDISILDSEDGESLTSVRDDILSEQATQEATLKKAKTKTKKKPRKRSDSSGGYNLSDIIQSPPATGLVKSEKTNSIESLQDLLASDSEGSFAGAGSPRDLQSPDLIAEFTPDKDEAKDKGLVVSTSTPPAVVSGTSCKMPKPKASSPEAIPSTRITSASSPNWVTVSFSPASPPAMDLRTIMEIEENIQKGGATPKLSAGVAKTASGGMKLSQKQRKMMVMSSKDSSTGFSSNENTPTKVASSTSTHIKSTGTTWASSLHSGEQKSFRDLLLEEQKSNVQFHSLGCNGKRNTPLDECDSQKFARKPARTLDHEAQPKCDVPQQDSLNPWLLTLSKTSNSAVPVTFATIVEEEKKQEAALIRRREKPLALIQIEEHAIQDLLVHYQALDNPDEYITVERAAQVPMATPMWNKH